VGRRVPSLRSRTCPLASPKEIGYAYIPSTKFFPFCLIDRVEEWYTRTIGSVHDWEELRDDFCQSFTPLGCSELLPCEFHEFGQLEGESISAAWARFSHLLELSSDLSIPEDVSFCTFFTRLVMESA
jgi:hypothetical protein